MSRKNWTTDKLFARLLNNRSRSTYWENISVLRSRPSKDVFNRCAEMLASNIPKERIIGIDVLAQLGTTPRILLNETTELFFGLLDREHNSQVFTSLLYAIWHNNENLHQTQIEKLIAFKNNKSGSIIDLGDTELLPTLRQQQKLAHNDSRIPPEWKSDLQNCINKLEEMDKKTSA